MVFTNGKPIQPFAEVATARKQELGLSFRELARRTKDLDDTGRGLSSAYLVQLFKGNEDPVPRPMRLVADALEMRPEDFIEYLLHEARHALDERVDFEQAVSNYFDALGADGRDRLRTDRAPRAGARRRYAVSR